MQRSRSRRRIVLIIVAVLTGGLLGFTPVARADVLIDNADSAEYGGSTLVQRIWYYKDSGGCYNGYDGVKLMKTTFTFKKADSQFTAHFKAGGITIGGVKCQEGSFSRAFRFSAPKVLDPGHTYTRTVGTPNAWMISQRNPMQVIVAYVGVNLYRGSQKKAWLCTSPRIVSPGEPCRVIQGE